ncbi:MAG: hypothetical protein WCT07_02875 [Candidatus Paceibacterota bacterium]|jgi:hypothetical protein
MNYFNLKKKFNLLISTFFCLFSVFILPAYASQTSGVIDSVSKYAKVCHDTACSTYGTINFLPTVTGSSTAGIVITDTAITGYAWGSEVGWINMQPTGSGVTVNNATGLVYGTAWSQAGGWLNFRPSNSGTLVNGIPIGVSINPSGEFYGYAWLSGVYGGWVLFDCSSASTCVKTDYRTTPYRAASVTLLGASYFSSSEVVTTYLEKLTDTVKSILTPTTTEPVIPVETPAQNILPQTKTSVKPKIPTTPSETSSVTEPSQTIVSPTPSVGQVSVSQEPVVIQDKIISTKNPVLVSINNFFKLISQTIIQKFKTQPKLTEIGDKQNVSIWTTFKIKIINLFNW